MNHPKDLPKKPPIASVKPAFVEESSMRTRRRHPDPVGGAGLGGIVLAAMYEVPTRTPLSSTAHQGVVNLNQNGFGFVTEASGGSVFIRSALARPLLTGDEIWYSIAKDSSGSEDVSAISQVRRQASILMCEVVDGPAGVSLKSDDPCFLALNLSDEELASCIPGDVVSVQVPAYSGRPVLGRVDVTLLRNLGPRSLDVAFSTLYAQVKFGFDKSPDASLLEDGYREAAEPNIQAGVDCTPYLTIDGASSQDLDDAIFARKRSDGTWTVRVAISDVSAIVTPGSKLDAWAAAQCTSVYLPGGYVPMLPTELSSDLCSLREGEVRRAVALSLHLSADGDILGRRIERRQIRTQARLTYSQVAKFMAGRAGVRFSGAVEVTLQALEELGSVLYARRRSAGMLEIEEPDPQLVKDETGSWKLIWESRTPAHKMVEEFMLLANREAAALMRERYGFGIFRHQPAPDAEKWAGLTEWAKALGYALPAEPSLKALVDLVNNQAEVSPAAQLNAFAKLRTVMRPAKYVARKTDESVGHFSLNLEAYTHFTSPIRRQADLRVHRLLLAPPSYVLSETDMQELAEAVEVCSVQTQKARQAERSVWDRLKLQCLTDTVAKTDELNGRVLRCTARGARILINPWQCAAWVLADELRPAGFTFKNGVWTAGEKTLQEGQAITCNWVQVSTTLPAYPELQVKLA